MTCARCWCILRGLRIEPDPFQRLGGFVECVIKDMARVETFIVVLASKTQQPIVEV